MRDHKPHSIIERRGSSLAAVILSFVLTINIIPSTWIGGVYAETGAGDEALKYPEFLQEIEVDGVTIAVDAPEGVFPADAKLDVSKITDKDDLAKAEKAADKLRDKDSAPDYSYYFDIKVIDSESNELQPVEVKDEDGVTISFSKETDEKLEAGIYKIVKPDEDENTDEASEDIIAETPDENAETSEEPEWDAVKCDVEQDPETNAFKIQPDSFASFALDLTIAQEDTEQEDPINNTKAALLGAKGVTGSDPFSEYWNEDRQQYSLPSGIYTLTEDYQLNGRIYIRTDAEVIIDLGGKTLSGNTGGVQINYGGVIGNYGTLTVKNGTITGGKAKYGGGIFNFDSGVLNVEDVTITGNEATKNGGGIYSDVGDGDGESKVTITGATITGNTAGEKGGGIYCDGTLNMSGKVIVEENDSTNLYLEAGRVINVTGAFEEGSSIGVTGTNYPCYLTSGLSASGNKSIDMFTPDNAPVGVTFVSAGGELYARKSDITVNSWAALQTAVNNAPDNTRTVIELSADCKASSDQDRIQIPANKKIEIDLAGHILNRNRTSSQKNGHVIEVFGKLTVVDSSAAGSGQIRGGFATRGGGINISKTGECELKSGSILGNKASTGGGGVYVHGIFKMSGGAINTNETTGSGADGGGIYVDGDDEATLEITGGTIASNTTDTDDDKGEAGAGILVKSGANVSISNATFDDNWSREEGAAIYTEASIDINNCTFKSNHTVAIASTKEEYDPINHYYYYRLDDTYDGGAIYINGSSAVVNIKDSKFTGNYITNYALQNNHGNGGAIYLNKGTLKISGSSFQNNKSWEGGAIYSKSGTTVSAENTTFSGNNLGITKRYSDDQAPKKIPVSSKGGGAISSYGTLTLKGCTFTGNYLTDATEAAKGGAIYSKGSLTLNGCTFTGNKGRTGGAIYQDGDNAELTNCIIKENSASMLGGGIYANKSFNVNGSTIIRDNSATSGNDVYLPDKKYITLKSSIAGSDIGVALEKTEGQFSKNFSTYHKSDIPEAYFYSCDGFDVILKNGEGYIQKGSLDTSGKFINWKDRINYNSNRLSGPNWMSGVSGERYLNEINIPGTHDSSMHNVSKKGCMSGEIGRQQAITQREYLNQQLEHGARFFDIRMRTTYCSKEYNHGIYYLLASPCFLAVPVIGVPLAALSAFAGSVILINESAWAEFKDDGVNLWTCHGRSMAGTFFALNEKDKNLSVAMELEWMKDFLKEHPTETIIIDARPETDKKEGEEFYGPLERFKGILEELSKEKNPSTGESYVYWEDGKVGEKYTRWPQLKDCRGKIVLFSEKGESVTDVIGGLCSGVDGVSYIGAGGTYQDGTKKAEHLKEFLETHNKLKIPRNATKPQMKDHYWIKMNTTDTMFILNPVQLAEQYVLPTVFGSNGLVNESKKGTYFGWFTMDAARANHHRDVWITNFPNDLDYCTVTVKSGLSGNDAPEDQVYKLLRGTTIPIPGCIYEGTQADKFVGWKANVDNKTHSMNSTYKIEKDVIFTAQWSGQMQTPVTVVWNDAGDLDGKRPATLSIGFKADQVDYTETIRADKDWTIMLSGNLSGDPVVKSVPTGYTADVKGSKGSEGYTVTMTHTPDVPVNASGTVTWDDDKDKDGIRPSSVKLHLYADGEKIKSGTATAGSGWAFDLGTYPRYKNGELVAYKLVEDEISVDEDKYCSGYTNYVEAVSGGKNAITSFKVKNTHKVTTSVMYARIEWDDNNDEAGERPESVTVNWMKNGEPYGDPIVVEPNDEGEWIVDLEMTYSEMMEAAQELDAITRKCEAGEITEEEFRKEMESNLTYSIKQNAVDGYTTTISMAGGKETEDGRTDSYYQVRNTHKNHKHDEKLPEYKLTFYEDTEGKVVWKEMTLDKGESLTRFAGYGTYDPDILEKDGCILAGWATEPNIVVNSYYDKNGKLNPALEGKLVDWNTTITRNTSVYPVWIRDRIVVVIDPDADDVKIDDAQSLMFTANINEKIAMRYLKSATREGYDLDGWYTKSGTLWNGENWKDLDYVSDGWNETAGWGVTPEYCDKDENGDPVIRSNTARKFNYRILTLTAHWTPKKVAVRYDLGAHPLAGADIPANGDVTLGNTVTLATAPEAASEYIFTGWKAPDGKLYSAGGTLLFDDWKAQDDPNADAPSITMTAQYVEKAKATLIFDANGGTAVEPLIGHQGNSIDLSDSRFITTRTGYDFDGWYNADNAKCEGTYTFGENETLTAHWKAKQYTITFDSAGGNEVKSITQDYDSQITAPEDPAKEHYTFAGWTPALPEKMPAKDITVKAKWDPKSYKITFDTDGGSKVAELEDIFGAPVSAPEDPTKDGYTFKGWMDDSSAIVSLPAYMPDTNPTYTAKWEEYTPEPQVNEYSLTFYEDTAGEKVWNKITLKDGEPLEGYADYGTEKPNIIEKEGYTFAGWATEPNVVVNSYRDKYGELNTALEGKIVNWNTTITKDMSVYPIWIRDRLIVSIVPDADDPDDVIIDDEQSLKFTANIDEKIVMRYLASATRDGYTLDGWYTNGGTLWNGKNWKDLDYVSDGWDETAGWGVTPEYCDKDENGDPVIRTNDERKYTYRTITLTAHWTPRTVAVMYDLGDHAAGGAAPAAGEVILGNTVTLPEAPKASNDYIFTGWKAPDGKLYSAGGTLLFDDWKAQDDPNADAPSITMTAQYVEKAKATLIFDANGGTAVEPLIGHQGNSIDLSDSRFITTRTGYDFDGWYNADNAKCEGTYTFGENETLTAHWKVKQYTITFDSSGGSKVSTITQDYDSQITAPKDPAKEHYTFAGWTPALPEKMPAKDITVKAIWDPKSYKITFDTDGGSKVAEIEDIFGAPVSAPEDPTKDGYTFKGWMDDSSAIVSLPAYMPDTNPTYTAKWEKTTPETPAHEHGMTHTVAKAATCTENGNIEYWICDKGAGSCGKYFSDAKGENEISKEDTVIKATGHDWGEWIETKSSTCAANGKEIRLCWNDSSHMQTRETEAKEHTPGSAVKENEVAATCEKNGSYYEVVYCTVCKKELSRERKTVAALGHDWGEWKETKAPTCSTVGEKERVCKNDASHKDIGAVAIDPDAHDWGEWTVIHEATETEKGEMIRTCSNNQSHLEILDIPVLGHEHKLTKVDAVAATCTKAGNIEYWICAQGDDPCKKLYADENGNKEIYREDTVIKATGHSLNKTAAVKATCTENGNKKYWTCENCGHYFGDADAEKEIKKDSWIIKATGHEWGVWTQTKAPTCSDEGEKQRVCKNDSSHEETETVAIDPDAHDWGKWVETKAATEKEKGEETRSCRNDPDHSETRAIPALDHEHKLTKVDAVVATCTKDGNIEYWICDQGDDPCGRYYIDENGNEEIDKEATVDKATGHDWGEWKETKAPTCSAAGEKQRVCKNDASHKDIGTLAINPDAHEWGEWTQTKAPTCSAAGEKQRVCKNDSNHEETETLAIDPDAHDWGEWTVIREATEKRKGEEIRICKNNTQSHIERREIPVLGHEHKLTKIDAADATCTEDGNIEYWICDQGANACNRYFADKNGEKEINKEDTVIKATGHKPGSEVKENEVAAACEKDGSYDEVVYCTVCKEELSRETRTVPALGHDWGEWQETKAATETEEGEETRTCKNDPTHTETRVIPRVIPQEPSYRNVSGDGNVWYKGSNETSDFAFKRSMDDASTITHFTGISVDGKDVDSSCYTKESGSVIIKLKPEYLETLELGTHTLTAQFDDWDGSASAEFTIAEQEAQGDDDGDAGTDDDQSTKGARTGDETMVVLWEMFFGGSLLLLILLAMRRRMLRR